MAEPKTRPTDASVEAFLAAVPDARRRTEAVELAELIRSATGVDPIMWGTSIVGYGSMPVTNTTGTYEWPIVAFSPRKSALTIYGVYNDYAEPDPIMASLGEHTVGKGCLYIKRLDRVDRGVLEQLVRRAWAAQAG